MSQVEKGNATGIKVNLEKINSEILKINQEISDNALVILNLKNQSAKLNNMFNGQSDEIERNIKMDVEKLEEEFVRNYKNHANSRKMLERKVGDLENSQLELAQMLFQIQNKVKTLEESLG